MTARDATLSDRPSYRWVPAIFSMELRKIFSYRMDFWLQFVGGFLAQFVVSYFLWLSIFEFKQAESVGGYSFSMLVGYYIFSPFIDRIVRANNAFVVSQEIYDGSLSRYLLYPINYLGLRFIATLAHALVGLLQMAVGVAIIFELWGVPEGVQLTLSGILMGTVGVTVSVLLYYLMATSLELVAFWADNVWSLLVMLQFTTAFVGGSLVPVSIFPEWAQDALALTPFPYLIGYPVQAFLGQLSFQQWLRGIEYSLLWTLPLALVLVIVWGRGRSSYTGVGM